MYVYDIQQDDLYDKPCLSECVGVARGSNHKHVNKMVSRIRIN